MDLILWERAPLNLVSRIGCIGFLLMFLSTFLDFFLWNCQDVHLLPIKYLFNLLLLGRRVACILQIWVPVLIIGWFKWLIVPSQCSSLIFACVDKKRLARHEVHRIFNAIMLIAYIMTNVIIVRLIISSEASFLEESWFLLNAESLRNYHVVVEIIVKLFIVS